jgi:hypothetical protein
MVILEPLLQPPKIENPMENQTLGPLEAHSSAPPKIEILDPAMLLRPPLPLPPSTAPEASEQTLFGDGLDRTHRLSEVFYQSEARIMEETNRLVLKPEMVIQGESPFVLFPSSSVPLVSESIPRTEF